MSIHLRKFNILISSFGYVNGPGYQRTFKIAQELAQIGHHVTFLTSQNEIGKFPYKVSMRGGVKEVAVFDFAPKKIKKLGLSAIAAVFKIIYIIRNKYDILHSDTGHRLSSGIPCWFHKLFFGSIYLSEWWDDYGKGGQYDNKPFIWRYLYGFIDNYLETYDKKKADGLIVLSEYSKNRALKLGVKKENISIVHGGADIRNIQYVSDHRYRNKYNLKLSDFVIVFVDVTGENDFGPILPLFSELKETIDLKIVTTGRILPKNIRLKHGLSTNFMEFGWINYNQYFEVLSLADIFLLYQTPNRVNKAKWPNKIGDYLCAGRVIITNPINDVSVLNSEKSNSIIYTDMNPVKLKHIIYKLFNIRNSLLNIGRHNRSLAEQHSWAVRSKQVEQFYYKILNERTHKSKG